MAPRLPRMYWGEIIYATPGSGKTYVANKYEDVIDGDDLIVKAIKRESPSFVFDDRNDPRIIIGQYFRFIHFNPRIRKRIYARAVKRMRRHCSYDDVVLLGTKDLMHLADRIFIQEDDYIVRNGFNQEKELEKLEEVDCSNVYYIDRYLDGCLQKLCADEL